MKKPVHEAFVPVQTWYAGTDREMRGRALSDLGGVARVGFGLLELAPGCHTRPAHYHMLEEEHVYVLSGEGVLHLGDETFDLRAGSYVCFPAGQRVYHHISNDSDEWLRYIMVGERIEEDAVFFKPDQTNG